MFTKAALSSYRLALALAACLVAVATAPGPARSATADTPPALTPMFFTAIHDAGHNPVTTVLSGTTVHDTGSLSSALGTPTGMVSFTWFSNADCGGIGMPAGSVAVSASGLADGSTPVGPLAPGDYSFSAHFTTFNTVQWTDADSACEPLHVTSAPVLALSGTSDAASAYARTIEWGITKSADPASQTVAPGDPATVDYTVTVTHDDGTDSDWQAGGQITVHNQNNAAVDGVTVSDAIDDPNATCVVSGGSSTIPAGGTVAFDYTCTYSSAPADPSQTSTATISWPAQTLSNFSSLPAGSAVATADVAWGDPTAVLNASIDVRDSLNGLLNSLFYTDPSPVDFTYPYTFDPDPAGECTPHDNTASVVNDAAVLASATATVEVCSGRRGSDLTVTKTATPTFTRTFGWDVKKSVDRHGETIAAGNDAMFAYTVDVTKGDPVDSGWAITGKITVSNPNSWDIDADLDDGSCSLEQTSLTVPANGSVAVGYSCSLTNGAPGENTATATWDGTLSSTPSDTATGSADYAFTTPTTVLNDSVDVYDNGTKIGTTDKSTSYQYSKSFDGVAGTCTNYDNTATVKSAETVLASSDKVTVQVCAGENVTVKKTATAAFTRTYTWSVKKSVDKPGQNIPNGASASFTYTVDVTKGDAVDSDRALSGTITVANPNDFQDVAVSLADSLPGCTLAHSSVTVPKSGSVDVGYTCPVPGGSSGTNTATATWDNVEYPTPGDTASGSADYALTTPTTVLNDSVDVYDNGVLLGPTDHSTTFTYSKTFPGSAGTCTTYDNTATVKSGASPLASSDKVTVTVCAGGDIAVAKTATTSFTRTYKWKITKSVAAPTTVTKAGGGTATFDYTVGVTGDGYVDGAWVVSGKITLTNPNDWQAVTVSLADSLPGCTLSQSSVTVPKSQSVDVAYTCPLPNGSSGTNTATATWDTAAFPTPHGSAAASAGFAFGSPTTELDKTVTVTDTFDGSTSTLGTVAHPGPGTFSYTRTVGVPVTVSCVTHPNTARIVETGQTAGASVTACGAASTISGTAWNDQNNNHVAGDAGDVILPGWTIRIYDAQNQLLGSTVTDSNGVFSFLEPAGTYKVCEVLQPGGWVETVPVAGTATCNGTGEAGQGYSITIGGADSPGNNFGNNLASTNVPDCKEDPNRAPLMTRVVDTTGKTHGPAPVYSTIQKAYDAAANTGEVIGVFTPTTENIVLGGSKTLTITECGAAKETAADNSKPVWDVKSTGKLTIISPSTYGGTVGWLIETNGNDIKSVRAYNASQYGVRIKGSSNGVSFNSVSGSPVGVQIDGNSNDVRSGTISGNTTGVVIAGSSNSLSGATIGPNTRDGVDVTGSNNTVKGTTASENGGDGFQATGTGTLFDSNKAYKNTGNGFTVAASATGTKLKSNASNTGNSGSSNENGGYEYKFGVAITNQGSNKKDNANFTSAAAGNYE